MKLKKIGEVSMVKCHKDGWMSALVFIGVVFLMCPGIFAENANSALVNQFSMCQNSLKHFSLHLEKCSKVRPNQAYYEDLYNQTQEFLSAIETIPTNSSQLSRCENLLRVVQDIVGSHKGNPDLAPMPLYSTPSRGKLTNSILETSARRPMRKHVQYMYDDGAAKIKRESRELADGNEDIEQLHLISKPGNKA